MSGFDPTDVKAVVAWAQDSPHDEAKATVLTDQFARIILAAETVDVLGPSALGLIRAAAAGFDAAYRALLADYREALRGIAETVNVLDAERRSMNDLHRAASQIPWPVDDLEPEHYDRLDGLVGFLRDLGG